MDVSTASLLAHTAHVRVVCFRPLAEDQGASRATAALKQQLQGEDSASTAAMHVLLRAADSFKQTHKRFPGQLDECVCHLRRGCECTVLMVVVRVLCQSACDAVCNRDCANAICVMSLFFSSFATANNHTVSHLRSLEEDVVALKSTAMQLLHAQGLAGIPLSDDVVAEVVRYGAGELQCVAAVVGGMASQESIKLLTRQFVPLQGTLVYNAVSSTTLVVS